MRSKNALLAIVVSVCAFVLASSCDLLGGSDDDPAPKTPVVTYAWSALGSGVGADADFEEVEALAFDASGNLYAGGSFTKIGTKDAGNIAKWNGSSWSSLGAGLGTGGEYGTDKVEALVFDTAGNLYAGGSFNSGWAAAAQGLGLWDGAEWSVLGSYPSEVGTVRSLHRAPSGTIFASFYQHTDPAINRGLVASWSGSSWTYPSSESEKVSYPADALAVDASGNLYQGGTFETNADLSTTLNYIAKCSSGSNTLTTLGEGLDDVVKAMVVDASGNLFVGGEFYQTADSTPVVLNCVAKWNGSAWSPLGDGFPWARVYALALDSEGNLYAGGNFEEGIKKWDGSSWVSIGGGVNGDVKAILFDASGNLYIGGAFTKAGDVNALNVAKWSKQ